MIKRLFPASGPALTGLIDYAGLFPPAGLGMQEAVRNYAAYSKGKDAYLLGRFVVPASRLEEFSLAAGEMDTGSIESWPLSVLLGPNSETDIAVAAGSPEVCWRTSGIRVAIDCVETKTSNVEEIHIAAKAVPSSWTIYFEISLGNKSAELIAAAHKVGACAKMRTGGLTAEVFPKAEYISEFISTCAAQKIRFKATAGLHHAVRSVHPFTYEKDSPSGWMHGFLNVLLASALAQAGTCKNEITGVLEEKDAKAFRFEDDGVHWKDHSISYKNLERTRATLFTSFGSCSFTEPTSELHALQIL